jgi:predicted nucleic acid-binding protein
VRILDTNLWVFGTLGTSDRAERLLDEIERGETVSAVNAYMIQEALEAFDRTPGLSPSERDEVKTQLLARVTGLQPKDVPTLVLAFQHREREPVVLTNDSGFASFTPDGYNLEEITVEHVE